MEKTERTEQDTLVLAVRKLVESVFSRRAGPAPGVNIAMASLGREAHRLVQEARGEGYLAEESLVGEMVLSDRRVVLSGRADGVFNKDGRWTVEEIKLAAHKTLAQGEEPQSRPEHWAQLYIYCWMLAMDKDEEVIVGRLTRATEKGEIVSEEEREVSAMEAEDYTAGLVESYLDRLEQGEQWAMVRNRSIQELPFPFPAPRTGQMELAMEVRSACREGSRLLAEAPTGLGKTMAVLFPSIKSLAEGCGKKVFFLTAKTTGKAAAEQALDRMRDKGLRIRSTTLTAKDRICPRMSGACAPETCSLFHGYVKRGGGAVEQGLDDERFSREYIEALAREYEVCPFELGLDLAWHSDVVIGDYNHALDPRARLIRFFETEKGPWILLFDEAHNLVDRSRDIFSAHFFKKRLPSLAKRLRPAWPDTSDALGEVNDWFLETFRDMSPGETRAGREAPAELGKLLRTFARKCANGPLAEERHPDEDLVDVFYEARGFLAVLEGYGQGHATLYKGQGASSTVSLICLDPADSLSQALDMEGSAIFFSATLSPEDYYRRMFGMGRTDPDVSMPSPFAPEHLGVMVVEDVSTLYRDRERTADQVARTLLAQYEAHPGRYLYFFPSYQYLSLVLDHFRYRAPYVRVLVQERSMGEGERTRFLRSFESESDQGGLAGFAVLGGVFAEGVDLAGEQLHGAAIVGVGLPPTSPRLSLIREHFDAMEEPGYHFAFTYPGVTKVLQAAGRIIRTETDRGSLLLLDARWTGSLYRNLMPSHWEPRFVTSGQVLEEALDEFWEQP